MDALDLATLIEEEARQRYEVFASQLGRTGSAYDAGSFFASMAENEAKHGNELLAKRIALFGKVPMNLKLVDLYDVEAPDMGAPRRGMSTVQAFEVGIAAEKKAYETSTTGPCPASLIPRSRHCSPSFETRSPNTSRCYKRQWPNYPRALASRLRTTPMMLPISEASFTI
jgi:hypothetical protein